MPNRRDLTFTMTTGKNEPGDEPIGPGQSRPPLRFLVLGEFSRHGRKPLEPKSRRVTFANFDDVLSAVTRSYSSLDQFHPDFVADVEPELAQLLQLRRQLKDSAKRPAAVAELTRLQQRIDERAAGGAAASGAPAPQSPEPAPELLARLLGGRAAEADSASAAPVPEPSPAGSAGAKSAVDRLVQHALKTTTTSPTSVDRGPDDLAIELLNTRCRSALLEPDFRALERAWRSVHWLVSRLESDQGEVHVLDISKAELTEHLAQHARDLDTSPLVRLLCDDADGWDFIIGDYSFGLEAEDLMLLGNLGAIAASAGAPLLAHGELSLAGCTSPELFASPSEWSLGDSELSSLAEQVRRHPAAKWIGLATPRFLLRHPYGKRTDPIESFPFEELPADPDRERFLWGNPAFVVAWILGQAHSRGGARWPLRQTSEVLDLPMPVHAGSGGDVVQAPVELMLSDAARAIVEQHGLIAFAGSGNLNRISTTSVHALATT